LNCNPPDICLLSSYDYRHEPLAPSHHDSFFWGQLILAYDCFYVLHSLTQSEHQEFSQYLLLQNWKTKKRKKENPPLISPCFNSGIWLAVIFLLLTEAFKTLSITCHK
jgi:hypothetical protein